MVKSQMKPVTVAQAARWLHPTTKPQAATPSAWQTEFQAQEPRHQDTAPIAHPAPLDPALLGEKADWDIGF